MTYLIALCLFLAPVPVSHNEPGAYRWHAGTGPVAVTNFQGNQLPTGWFEQSKGNAGGCVNSCDDHWSASQTTVAHGYVSVATSCGQSMCKSGGIGQSDYTYTDDVAIAIEARVVTPTYGIDDVIQLGEYPVWPPEIDAVETWSWKAHADSYLHCAGDGTVNAQQSAGWNAQLTKWQTYEVDWSTTSIRVWVGARLVAWFHRAGVCGRNWPSGPMGIFLQSQAAGQQMPANGASSTLQVAWIATRAL